MSRKKKLETRDTQYIAVYVRVSTDEQADSGLGIEAQKVRCNAMAIASGYTEDIKYYADEGVSGAKPPTKREQCRLLLNDVEEGKIKAIIVSSLDRLGRKVSYIINLSEEFKNKGVAFISCKEKFDTATPQGAFVLHMFAAMAELERGLTSQRTIEALGVKGSIDGEKGGRIPYGYRRIFTLDEKSGKSRATGIEIDSYEAKFVRLIFKFHAQKKSLAAIANILNTKTISPRGGKWYASGVREILLNKDAYMGGNRGESNIQWPPILEKEH